ncbi:hypothetical protein Pst134EB_029627 [Puccinia striiformis f. sp. tritici]|uniref:CCHC-type domain-containing protein n=1 Tax=Puccinia striiformis f. sp. tritici PST-78 TaxID=1165861 RepID=A0A0L0W1Y7_9BASI|nr:hypothetical protein Pst134EB_029627 [Puccinia striiformis f. sp. tritici]KNF05472.1 hypothetical protein PSTG_01282 [Puccinia striiformis f. sp. tritici PST-78]
MSQELASLKQQLRSLLPNCYNNPGVTQQYYPRHDDRPPAPGKKLFMCFYCHRESHNTYKCPDFFKDEEQGLVHKGGKDWYLSTCQHIPWNPARPIQSVVASTSANPQVMEATDKLKFRKNNFVHVLRPQTPPAFKSSAQLVDWEPPQLGAEIFLKNQAITRADAQKGRRNIRIQDPEDNQMDLDHRGKTQEHAQEATRNIPEKMWSKEKSPVKAKKSTLEEALFQELEHVKLPTTFAQLTAISPSYTEQVIAKLQERLHDKSSATYMANKHTKLVLSVTLTIQSSGTKKSDWAIIQDDWLMEVDDCNDVLQDLAKILDHASNQTIIHQSSNSTLDRSNLGINSSEEAALTVDNLTTQTVGDAFREQLIEVGRSRIPFLKIVRTCSEKALRMIPKKPVFKLDTQINTEAMRSSRWVFLIMESLYELKDFVYYQECGLCEHQAMAIAD